MLPDTIIEGTTAAHYPLPEEGDELIGLSSTASLHENS